MVKLNGSGKWGGNFELSPNNRSYNVETISCAKNRFYLNYSAPQIFDAIFNHILFFVVRTSKSKLWTLGAGIGNETGIPGTRGEQISLGWSRSKLFGTVKSQALGQPGNLVSWDFS